MFSCEVCETFKNTFFIYNTSSGCSCSSESCNNIVINEKYGIFIWYYSTAFQLLFLSSIGFRAFSSRVQERFLHVLEQKNHAAIRACTPPPTSLGGGGGGGGVLKFKKSFGKAFAGGGVRNFYFGEFRTGGRGYRFGAGSYHITRHDHLFLISALN